MTEEIARLTKVSKEATQSVAGVKTKTDAIEADLKTLAHNIQGFTEEDGEDEADEEHHHHHRRASHHHHRGDESTTDSAMERYEHEHDFGVFIGKLPAAAATDEAAGGGGSSGPF